MHWLLLMEWFLCRGPGANVAFVNLCKSPYSCNFMLEKIMLMPINKLLTHYKLFFTYALQPWNVLNLFLEECTWECRRVQHLLRISCEDNPAKLRFFPIKLIKTFFKFKIFFCTCFLICHRTKMVTQKKQAVGTRRVDSRVRSHHCLGQ